VGGNKLKKKLNNNKEQREVRQKQVMSSKTEESKRNSKIIAAGAASPTNAVSQEVWYGLRMRKIRITFKIIFYFCVQFDEKNFEKYYCSMH